MTLSSQQRVASALAFTLVEMMVTMAIFAMVVAAMVSTQLFGLRINSAATAKVNATAGARFAMDQVRDRVRDANGVSVGSWNGTVFTAVTNGSSQQGNAVQILTATSSIPFYVCYLSATNQLVMYYGDGTNGWNRVLAGNIANQNIFDAEDFQGNVLTNNQNNRVIRMSLDIFQRDYVIGAQSSASNYYQLRTRMAQRLLN